MKSTVRATKLIIPIIVTNGNYDNDNKRNIRYSSSTLLKTIVIKQNNKYISKSGHDISNNNICGDDSDNNNTLNDDDTINDD